LCLNIGYIGSGSDGWLWDILHVFFCGVHVVYVTHQCAVAVSCKVAWFSAVETGAFRSRMAWFFLWLCGHCVRVLGGHHVCIHVVALVLSVIVRCPGSRQVHGDWYIIVCRSWGISGIVRWPLLLLWLPLLLVLLGVHPPCPWLELVSVLTKGVIECPGVRQPLPGPDKFNHLSALCDFDSFSFVFIIGGGEQGLYDFV
jgi:hypothetical protein